MSDVIIFSTDHEDEEKLLSGSTSNATAVPIADLEANILDMAPAINSVVGKLKETAKGLGLTEVTLSIGINGKGKVGFLGTGAEIGGEASISLKFQVGT